MQKYEVYTVEQARAIITAYKHCSDCGQCPLSTPEGWYCSHMYEQACEYIAKHDIEVQ